MFINWSEWKMIEVFSKVDSIEPKNLAKTFVAFSETDLKKTIDSLIKKNILNYFWVGSSTSDHSSYNLKSTGNQIARRGFFKHNAIELFGLIDKHKAWVSTIAGIVAIIIALRKC